MGKVLLLILGLLGAALYFPESREAVVETVRPALNPWHRWLTHQQMDQIVNDLQFAAGAGGTFPVRSVEFEDWLQRRYRDPRLRVDGWGNPYRLEVRGGSFRVVSAGPDGELNTEDDLVREGSRLFGTGRP